ncbi:hypothetical protein JTB14_013699 [Gonioctena quinquepunctata]|nr:hypothetical protein JTB14_013699 [Gonioctena quinquepunctata]
MEFLKQPEEMSLNGDLALNWKEFKAAYKLYIVASGCSAKQDEVKAAILLHIIGNGAREILEKLSSTEDEEILNKLFNRAIQYGVRFNPEKCNFFATEVKYIGHIISKDRIEPDNKKVEAIH